MAPQTVFHRLASPGVLTGRVPAGATVRTSGQRGEGDAGNGHGAHPAEELDQLLQDGAKMNWPKEPPALMTPEAAARDSIGSRCALAPISTESWRRRCRAPSRPRLKTRPQVLSMNGVIALPSASRPMPAISTGPGPWRSASAPASGWMAPQENWATAGAAKLIETTQAGTGVDRRMKRPSDWRAPWSPS